MKQQTSIEWLQECISKHLTHEQLMQFEGLFQQAKEMEKEHILNAYDEGYIDKEFGDYTPEQYYNEEY